MKIWAVFRFLQSLQNHNILPIPSASPVPKKPFEWGNKIRFRVLMFFVSSLSFQVSQSRLRRRGWSSFSHQKEISQEALLPPPLKKTRREGGGQRKFKAQTFGAELTQKV